MKAQETATTSLNYSALEKKFTKSNEAIMDEKDKLKEQLGGTLEEELGEKILEGLDEIFK